MCNIYSAVKIGLMNFRDYRPKNKSERNKHKTLVFFEKSAWNVRENRMQKMACVVCVLFQSIIYYLFIRIHTHKHMYAIINILNFLGWFKCYWLCYHTHTETLPRFQLIECYIEFINETFIDFVNLCKYIKHILPQRRNNLWNKYSNSLMDTMKWF